MQASEAPDRSPDRSIEAALDSALKMIRSGSTAQQVLGAYADQPEIASELAAILKTHESLRTDVVPAPSTNGRMAQGKARFLAAAAVAAEADGALSTSNTELASADTNLYDALDVAMARIGLGVSLEAVLAEHSSDPARVQALRELLQTFEVLQSDAVTPPPMNGSLVRGRSHLVAAASVAAEAARNGELNAVVADALDAALTAGAKRHLC